MLCNKRSYSNEKSTHRKSPHSPFTAPRSTATYTSISRTHVLTCSHPLPTRQGAPRPPRAPLLWGQACVSTNTKTVNHCFLHPRHSRPLSSSQKSRTEVSAGGPCVGLGVPVLCHLSNFLNKLHSFRGWHLCRMLSVL